MKSTDCDHALIELIEASSDELVRASLLSYQLKFAFAKEKGFTGDDVLEQVHSWMTATHKRFATAVAAARNSCLNG